MEVTTQDATHRAKALLKRAVQNGDKPIRVFLGFRANGARKLLLMAQDSRADITRSLPQVELLVDPKSCALEELASSLTKHWTALQQQLAAMPKAPTSNPRRTHVWRRPGALGLRRTR